MGHESKALAMRDGGVGSLDEPKTDAVGAWARERYTLEGGILMALEHPRDEIRASSKLLQACERVGFADAATYSYPRGRKADGSRNMVEGKSVVLARAAATYWGNIHSGFRVLRRDAFEVHLMGFAYDLETNNYKTQEHVFRLEHQRKDRESGETRWQPITDEREVREAIGRQGSILERNCILRVIPADITDDAMAACDRTMRRAAAGDLEKDRSTVIRGLVNAFAGVGVSLDQLARHLGHAVNEISEDEVAEMRGIWNAIRDGEARVRDMFPPLSAEDVEPEEQEAQSAVDVVDAALAPDPEDDAEPAKAAPEAEVETAPRMNKGQRIEILAAVEAGAVDEDEIRTWLEDNADGATGWRDLQTSEAAAAALLEWVDARSEGSE